MFILSVRRSLFNNAERAKFLNQLVAGVRKILQNPTDLTEPNNYHEFCRLLARLKSNYQLGELVMVDNYQVTLHLHSTPSPPPLHLHSPPLTSI